RRPLRASRRRPPPASRRPRRRLHRTPGAVRPQATPTARAAHYRMDQQAPGGPPYDTVIPERICLRKADTRRCDFAGLRRMLLDRGTEPVHKDALLRALLGIAQHRSDRHATTAVVVCLLPGLRGIA